MRVDVDVEHDEADFVACSCELACHIQIGVFERATGIFLDIVAQTVSVVVVEVGENSKFWRNMNQGLCDVCRKHFAALAITDLNNYLNMRYITPGGSYLPLRACS